MQSVNGSYLFDELFFTKMPNDILDNLDMFTVNEFAVLSFILRQTIGYGKDNLTRHLTLKDFIEGRTRKDGTRICGGLPLSDKTIRNALKSLEERGIIIVETNTSDEARIRKYYTVNFRAIDELKYAYEQQKLDARSDDDADETTPSVKFTTPEMDGSREMLPANVVEFTNRTKKETLERKKDSQGDFLAENAPADDASLLPMQTAQTQPQEPVIADIEFTGAGQFHHGDLYGAVAIHAFDAKVVAGKLEVHSQFRARIGQVVKALKAYGDEAGITITSSHYYDFAVWWRGLGYDIPRDATKAVEHFQQFVKAGMYRRDVIRFAGDAKPPLIEVDDFPRDEAGKPLMPDGFPSWDEYARIEEPKKDERFSRFMVSLADDSIPMWGWDDGHEYGYADADDELTDDGTQGETE